MLAAADEGNVRAVAAWLQSSGAHDDASVAERLLVLDRLAASSVGRARARWDARMKPFLMELNYPLYLAVADMLGEPYAGWEGGYEGLALRLATEASPRWAATWRGSTPAPCVSTPGCDTGSAWTP